MIAAACALVTLILLICIACGVRVLPGRTAVTRARWAWRCRGRPPVPEDGEKLQERERAELITILRGRKKTARPERSRT